MRSGVLREGCDAVASGLFIHIPTGSVDAAHHRSDAPRYGRRRDERGNDPGDTSSDHTQTLEDPVIRRFVDRALLALLATGLLLVPAAPVRAADPLPAVPAAWPSDHLALGLADAPGGAAALASSGAFTFRYQYLAGGVNTGNGWSTWNANGQFVSSYIADSAAHGLTPVFPYYMLLQSTPSAGASEATRDLSNLRNTATMAAWYADLKLFFQRAAGSTTVVLHVEPDLWGYIEQAAGSGNDAGSIAASVASSGVAALAGLPDTAAGFARAIVRLRDQNAPNVLLAYHLSGWGTNVDIGLANTPDPQVDALAARAAAFYASLGAGFDLTFTDIADRDAAFKQAIYGDGGASWWDDADFVRYARFIKGYVAASAQRVVVWQVPLGNTKMRAMDDTWGHYQDDRVQWFLDDPGGTHLALWRDAGVIALLFGGGAGGTTCACDAIGDGITDPPAINGNSQASLSADDDGGFFRDRAAAYHDGGGLDLGGGAPPPYTPPPTVAPLSWARSATVTPASTSRRHTVTIKAHIRASKTTRAIADIRVYDRNGTRVLWKRYPASTFRAGVSRLFRPTLAIGTGRRLGRYKVVIRIYSADGRRLLSIMNPATWFHVTS